MKKAEKIAWAAGFFDGEGCFYAAPSKPRRDGSRRIYFKATCFQKERELIDRFQKIVGFGHVAPYKLTHNGDTAWRWETGSHGEIIFQMFKKWLSQKRLQKAKLIFKKMQGIKTRANGDFPPWNKKKP